MSRQGTTAEKDFSSTLRSTNYTEVSTLLHERFLHRRALLNAQASGPGVDNARFARRIKDMLTIFTLCRESLRTTLKKMVLRDCKFRFGIVHGAR